MQPPIMPQNKVQGPAEAQRQNIEQSPPPIKYVAIIKCSHPRKVLGAHPVLSRV